MNYIKYYVLVLIFIVMGTVSAEENTKDCGKVYGSETNLDSDGSLSGKIIIENRNSIALNNKITFKLVDKFEGEVWSEDENYSIPPFHRNIYQFNSGLDSNIPDGRYKLYIYSNCKGGKTAAIANIIEKKSDGSVPAKPVPAKPVPVQPAPVQPVPVQPVPAQAAPSHSKAMQ